MLNLAEYRSRSAHLCDFLPWAALIAPGIILNKDGAFQRTARFRGPDLESSVTSELMAISLRLNSAFRRLGAGWANFVEAQRVPADTYPQDRFPDLASALVDLERRAEFEESGAHYESNFYLTFVFLPSEDDTQKGESWLFEGRASDGANALDHVEAFRDQTERLLKLFEGFMPECAWLDDEESLTYLHSTISTNAQKIGVPETPMHLDALLADQPLTGGLSPRLGEAHLRILTLNGFPSATVPGILDDLNRLGFAYRWVTRAIMMDKLEANQALGRIRKQWFAKRKSIGAILREVMTQEASALVDNDATNKAADADAALQELGADVSGFAYITATLVVWDDDPYRADEKRRLVEKVIQGRDFTCMSESLNAVDAWLGSLPGQVYANVRQPPLSTLNLAHIMPVSAVWAGEASDAHLKAPPLFFAKTEGATPFRFSLHVGDVGHSLIIGPTGAGKSVLLGLMALQFRRYKDAQIFAFDFGASLRAATLSMGGDWQDLGSHNDDSQVRLQPLARIDDPAERSWASQWVCGMLDREGIALTPDIKALIWAALGSLASAPVIERTLSGLSILIQSQTLKQALAPFCLGGPHRDLLDADSENLHANAVQVFETQGLIGTAAAPAVFGYLFHRIEAALDGRPTLILIDEGWLALDDEGFVSQVKTWLKTLRKRNASVIFATQSLADIEASPIAPILVESCPSRLFLPNANAFEPQIVAIYRRFGLNDRQIDLIARARPKQDYYLQSARGHRLFELGLGPVALALTATSSKTDQRLIDQVINQGGSEDFCAAWLKQKGLDWAVELLPDLKIRQPHEDIKP